MDAASVRDIIAADRTGRLHQVPLMPPEPSTETPACIPFCRSKAFAEFGDEQLEAWAQMSMIRNWKRNIFLAVAFGSGQYLFYFLFPSDNDNVNAQIIISSILSVAGFNYLGFWKIKE